MPYPREHAALLSAPTFERYSRITAKNIEANSTVKNYIEAGAEVILGHRDGKQEFHAIRFPAEKFSEAEAIEFLKKNGIGYRSFEPAVNGSNGSEENFDSISTALAQGSAIEGEVEIAVAGKYPQGDLTTEIFDELIETFNPAQHEPPHVIGHITSEHGDRPAYGWISGLKRVGDKLIAKSKQIAKDLDDLVKVGRFKKRSIGIRFNDQGKRYLHHLAWLGAAVPACRGLKDVYMDYLDVNTQVNFEIENDNLTQGVNVKTYTEEEFKNEIARNTRETEERVRKECETNFAEKLKTETAAARKDERTKVEVEYSEKQKAAEKTANYRRDVDALIKDAFDKKKIVSAQVEPLRSMLYAMETAPELTYSETEGDKKVERKESALEAAKKVIANFSNAAPEGKLDDPDNAGSRGGEDANYAEEKAEVEKLMKEEKLSYGAALKKVNARRAAARK